MNIKLLFENSLPPKLEEKIELKNIDNGEIKRFEKSRQGEIGYSKKAGKLKAALQKEKLMKKSKIK